MLIVCERKDEIKEVNTCVRGNITHKEGLEDLAWENCGKKEDALDGQAAEIVRRERGEKELGVVLIEKARSRGLWNSMITKVNQYGT